MKPQDSFTHGEGVWFRRPSDPTLLPFSDNSGTPDHKLEKGGIRSPLSHVISLAQNLITFVVFFYPDFTLACGKEPIPGIYSNMLVNIRKPIDLFRGHPSTRLLATDLIRESAAKVLSSDLPQDSYSRVRHPLHYGPNMGNEDFRAEIGRWTAGRYGLKEAIPAYTSYLLESQSGT